MPNPLEVVKRVPWEVWVGLLLTIVIAWIATRQAVTAGQESAQTLDGAQVAEPLPQEPIVDAISAQSARHTEALAGMSDSFSLSQGELASMQQQILAQLSQRGTGINPATVPGDFGPYGLGSPYTNYGAALGTRNQNAASSSSSAAVSATTRAESTQPTAQPAVGGDIGTHSATDASGRTYTISKTYAAMSEQEKDDANRFAHGYSG
jgi:hypothetical protein